MAVDFFRGKKCIQVTWWRCIVRDCLLCLRKHSYLLTYRCSMLCRCKNAHTNMMSK